MYTSYEKRCSKNTQGPNHGHNKPISRTRSLFVYQNLSFELTWIARESQVFLLSILETFDE